MFPLGLLDEPEDVSMSRTAVAPVFGAVKPVPTTLLGECAVYPGWEASDSLDQIPGWVI